MCFFFVLAFSLFFLSNASSTSRDLDSVIDSSVLHPVSELHIANHYIAPDGYNRSATLVNGVFPGPLIQANKGDLFAVKLLNQLTDATMHLETSVHWHGIFQHKSNWADGVSFVTQCPLRQQQTFVQKFNAADQTGTFWYHSHYKTQYCDGLRGPLVIYDPKDPLAHLYDVDNENTIITLSDWYHTSSVELGKLFTRVLAKSTLINGKGRYAGGPATPLSVIHVQHGQRYRFRVIATSCDLYFKFAIDGHRMTVIEVDGTEVRPVDVDSIPILAGQRYSVVVTANQPVGNYWIRALSDLPDATFSGNQHMAILRYSGAAEVDPTSSAGPYKLSFDEGSLHPLVNPGAPGIPEIGKADVNLQLSPGHTSQGYWVFNNVTFKSPSVPVLLQILSGATHPSQLLPHGSVYELPPNKVIEINFPNGGIFGSPHPLHLHGHTFDVVRIAGSNKANFVNPVRRDVVSMGTKSTDNVTIRFVTDNPGPWFLHCHIDWHLNNGFAVVMAEARDRAAQEEAALVPPDWTRLCQT